MRRPSSSESVGEAQETERAIAKSAKRRRYVPSMSILFRECSLERPRAGIMSRIERGHRR